MQSEEEYYKNPKRCLYCGEVFKYEDKHRNTRQCCNRSHARLFAGLHKKETYEKNPKKCKRCEVTIDWSDPNRTTKIFCSDACMREHNKTENSERVCEHCGVIYTVYYRAKQKFCNHMCRAAHYSDQAYHSYIKKWLAGKVSGASSKFGEINRHVRRYVFHGKESCPECGFSKRNPVTYRVPLEVDHIDGNALNNTVDNLRVLCRNCHALTPTYGHLNNGKGRSSIKKGALRAPSSTSGQRRVDT